MTARGRTLLARVALAVLLGVSSVAVSFETAPGAAAAAPSATLTKQALDQSGNEIPNGSSLTPGSPIKWVLNYDNTSGTPAHARVTDPIGANQTFVPGTLQAPPIWSKEYSADGTTFGTTDLGTDTVAVRSQADVPSTSTGAAVPVPPPITSTFQTSATGGDGFRPILFGNDVFNIFHHTLLGGEQTIACTNASTGEACPGYPKTLSYGSPSETVSTSFTPMQFIRSDGKMFFPTQRAADYGVACFDLSAGTGCGYTQLSAPGTTVARSGDFPAMIEGAARVGTDLYFYGSEEVGGVFTPTLYCFDPAAQAACADGARTDLSITANGSVVGWNPGVNGLGSGLVVQLTPDGTRVYLDQAFGGPSGSQVSCFDTATRSACPGWSTPLVLPTPNFAGTGYGSFLLDPGAPGPHGICAASLGGYRGGRSAPREESCVAADKTPVPNFRAPSDVPDQATLEQVTFVPQLDSSYFAFFDVRGGVPASGYAFCWDWSANRECAAFPTRHWDTDNPPTQTPINRGDTRDYAYTYDPATNCMWGLGDAGYLWTFDARTGANPCRVGRQAIELVSPTSFYCDGKPGHVQGWNQVRFISSRLDAFAEIRVTILDSTNTPVPGFVDRTLPLSGPDAGVLDISSIPASGATATLAAQIIVNAPTNDPWANGLQPYAELTFFGDSPQICFQTTVAKVCQSDATSDQAHADTDGTLVESNKITFQIRPDATGCTPTLTKTAQDDIVPAGSPIGFTVTLANPGPNSLPGLTLTDALPAGSGLTWSIAGQQGPATCSITGAPPAQTLDCGTFTLAAGESQTVHLTSPTSPQACMVVDNTATASSPVTGDATAEDTVTVQCPTTVTTTPSRTEAMLGAPFHDTVVVADGTPVPTGTVTFALYGPGDTSCAANLVSGPEFEDVPLTPSGARSGDFTPTKPGAYQWVVHYSGDPLHSASSGACGDPTEQVAVVVTELTKTADHAVVSAGSPIGFTVTLHNPGPLPASGLAVTDALPAGSGLTWSIAGQQGPATCSITGAPPAQTLDCGTFTLAAGESQTVHLTSPTSPQACMVVDNTATASSPVTGDATAEDTVTVQCPTTVTTTPSRTEAMLGAPFHDTVVVADGTPVPTGTVTFALYGPGDTSCAANLVSGPEFEDVPLTPSGARSGDFTPTKPGAYQWVVHYSGDPLHSASSGACGDPTEQVAVVVTELTKTADHAVVSAGSPIGFTVTLHNPGPLPASGLAVTDALPAGSGLTWSIAGQQGPATCSITGAPPAQTLDCGTFTLAAGESQTVHLTSPTSPQACMVVDNTATAALAGDRATATSSITVSCPTSMVTTASSANGPVGVVIRDTAEVTGGQPPPTGTVKFALYAPGDLHCTRNLLAENSDSRDVLMANGQATSLDYTTTETGTYQWVATYNGDDVHQPAEGSCGDPSEQVTLEPGFTTQVTAPPATQSPVASSLANTGVGLPPLMIAVITLIGAGALLLGTTSLVTQRNRRRRHTP